MRKTQVQSRAETTTSLRTEVTTEVSKVSIVLVGVFAAIVGLWSLACIVGGIVSSGGVGGLLSGWLKAVTGM
jgi:small-conductance mechanosensitive channel